MIFRNAILIIHGFAGGTFDIEYLANKLELQRNFDVFTFTLPGHEYGLGDAGKNEWIKSAKDHIEELINFGYKNIYVIGHSMGGVIATYIASQYKEVKKLVLAAPAFHYLNFKNDGLDIKMSFKSGIDTLKEYKVQGLLARILKVPKHALFEFISLVKEYYDTPKYINIPIMIIQGNDDNVVPLSSSVYIYDNVNSSNKVLLKVENANHDIFLGKRKEEVVNEVIGFLKSKKPSGNIKKEI